MSLLNKISFLSVIILMNSTISNAQENTLEDKKYNQQMLQKNIEPTTPDTPSKEVQKVEKEVKVVKTDISNFLTEASKYYKEDKIFKALDSMESAEEIVRNIQSKQMEILLPTKVDGWQISKEETETKYATKGVSIASRLFSDGIDEVKISIIIDSPKINELTHLASEDDKGIKSGLGDYNGYIKKFYRNENYNHLAIVVGINALVEIEGYQLSHTNALKIADFVDLSAIADFSNK